MIYLLGAKQWNRYIVDCDMGWEVGSKAVIKAPIGKDFLKVSQLVSSGNCSPETQHSGFLTPITPAPHISFDSSPSKE